MARLDTDLTVSDTGVRDASAADTVKVRGNSGSDTVRPAEDAVADTVRRGAKAASDTISPQHSRGLPVGKGSTTSQ